MKPVVFILAIVFIQTATPSEGQQKARRIESPNSSKPVDVPLISYIPDDATIIVGLKPAQVLKSKLTTALVQHSGCQSSIVEVAEILKEKTGLNFADVEEVVLFADEKEIERIEMVRRHRAVRQRLKLVGLAMHNFHDADSKFPQHSGMTGVPQGNLSWRVFLLPMLGYESLYNEFDLKAPWDAPQNFRLISQMPKEFLTEGVNEAGKTSVHVLGGPGTPFGGGSAIGISDIGDGTAATIMTVQAGPNKAQFWTKPGPLEIDSRNPVSSLGDVGEEFCCGIMDGSVRYLRSDIAPEVFIKLAEHQDGSQFSWDEVELPIEKADRVDLPGILVRSAKPLDREAIVSALSGKFGKPESTQNGQLRSLSFSNQRLWFTDPTTMILASAGLTERIVGRTAKASKDKLTSQFQRLFEESQFVAIANESSLSSQAISMLASRHLPDLKHKYVRSQVIVNWSDSAAGFATIELQMKDRVSALQVESLLIGLSAVSRALLLESLPTVDGMTPEIVESNAALFRQIQVMCKGNSVHVEVPPIADVSSISTAFAPMLKKLLTTYLDTYERELLWREDGKLLHLGIAVRQYLSEFRRCPPAASSGNNLSWRVQLLPYLDEKQLYDQFHLDEPWDSPHNRQLIPKMPDVFATDRVNARGKTAFHVFDDDDAPFSSTNPAQESDIYDANEIGLFFLAAPETAVVWTKPGGLHFEPSKPTDVLTGPTAKTFAVAFKDGTIRRMDSQIDAVSMLKLVYLKKTRTPQMVKEQSEFELFLETSR